MRMALSASAHRPQKVQLARSSRDVRLSPVSWKLMAPVGQAAAAGRASAIGASQFPGRPRAEREISTGRVRITGRHDAGPQAFSENLKHN